MFNEHENKFFEESTVVKIEIPNTSLDKQLRQSTEIKFKKNKENTQTATLKNDGVLLFMIITSVQL